ncbi:DUF3397 domain-containing protein [Alkalihalobacillus sp. BA299]|uniref:DUF3397 domain-containing protein n=1 Tax=Alkalihalobacillus sp. BA299 TaxID=2815938 RepID=UPI001ADC4B16|nr:DUF3397 domain-containing protein [Alkalihalobacillus sp. BA299]
MSSAFAWFIATVVTLPIVGWYIVYIITVKITKKKSYSIRLAADISLVFFISAVYFISYEIWNQSFLWVILIAFFVVAICFTIIHWKVANDVHFIRLFRGIWRFNFILFFIVYIMLSTYGLISRLFNS